ncbi:LLM class flavin-dependent oxidoreductase [Streptomyces sp. NPDC052610]|uniref:LLM class flavin-dependent oxidoreductase n=1 Tax=Streptomyces sp. NPDC052610 TaxID=3154952 RepID=UPI00343E9C5E
MTTSPSSDVLLSVLDTAPVWKGSTATDSLRNTVRLARAVDRLGYHRFWLAEHHNMTALSTSSPAVLAGQVAAATRRLRVGAGGVMLPNHPPLVAAEQFGTLAALHPGRIDLGVGRAPGTDPLTARALRRQAGPAGGTDFPAQVKELLSYFAPPGADTGRNGSDGRTPTAGPRPVPAVPAVPAVRAVRAVPANEHFVPVWVLGSSDYSARLAAVLGLPFAYAHHFSPHGTLAALDTYRTRFQPSPYLSEPYCLVSVFAAVADDDRRGRQLGEPLRAITAQSLRGLDPLFPSVEEAAGFELSAEERTVVDALYGAQVFGGPETARQRIGELVETTGADEVMVVSAIQDHDERVRSYELLAQVTGRVPALVAARA